MRRDTLLSIFRRIEHRLVKTELVGDVVPPLKRFCIALERLLRPTYYKVIGDMYAVGKTLGVLG